MATAEGAEESTPGKDCGGGSSLLHWPASHTDDSGGAPLLLLLGL